mmetsp:Transcript_387/g.991  ORF Transcript_387/g.991 Transcript_387/m.991 type:complete len:89 (+) Transcript_387:1093-1359(+)
MELRRDRDAKDSGERSREPCAVDALRERSPASDGRAEGHGESSKGLDGLTPPDILLERKSGERATASCNAGDIASRIAPAGPAGFWAA